MASITITVQSLLNTAVYDSYTINNTQTVAQLKTAINSAQGFESTWYDVVNGNVLTEASTLSALGIATGTALRTHNKIGRLETKEQRQRAKLDLAALDRDTSGNARSTYDITEMPTQYSGNVIVDNPNNGGLLEGRPWIETVSSFTFYEAFGTTSAITTTQYVSGNKIYVYSSTFDVPAYQNAVVIVNDIEVLNVGLRGHNMVVLNSNGDLVSTARYDTYGVVGDSTALATALGAVATGNIVVLAVWDASALTAGVRSVLNSSYGSTNNDTWTAYRRDHIFIGIKS